MIRIENCSLDDCRTGNHTDFGANTILIQITDPAREPPEPARKFTEIYQFEFLDIDQSDIDKHSDDAGFSEFAVTDTQARDLVEILLRAKSRAQNVLVHCHAGICRSGGVVEVSEMIGFTPTNKFRAPNLLVKHKMMKVLGFTYSDDETPYMKNIAGEEDNGSKSFSLW